MVRRKIGQQLLDGVDAKQGFPPFPFLPARGTHPPSIVLLSTLPRLSRSGYSPTVNRPTVNAASVKSDSTNDDDKFSLIKCKHLILRFLFLNPDQLWNRLYS
jgi:hypothetical protein